MQKIQLSISNNKATALNIIDKVKTFEDACAILGITGDVFSGNINDALAEDSKAIVAHLKLLIIVKALNEGWTPNWNDDDEYKFYPWFNMQDGFVLYNVSYYYTHSNVSSRLCFKSRELAEYAVKQFGDLYKDFMVIE